MSARERITTKLTEALAPESLDVIDESERHRGHGGWREGGETHFRLKVVSAAFAGKSRIDRHRLVNALLADDIAGGIHALALELKAPGE